MKKIGIGLLIGLLSFSVFGQNENQIKTEASQVKVFLQNAQVTRIKTIDLIQGKSILKFVDLSPFIDEKSIQVKATGNMTVLSVNHQLNYLKQQQKTSELEAFENQLKELESKLQLENTYLSILKEEFEFLMNNRNLSGKDQAVSVIALKDASSFFKEKITSLKMSEVEHNKNIEKLMKEKEKIENQMRTISGRKEYPSGEIWVEVDAPLALKANFEIRYIVDNAGWFPSYDIKAKNINEPIQLVYKANVHQDSREDWKNVKLSFSSGDPNLGGNAPRLKTYFLDYYLSPPIYKKVSGSVSGKVFDRTTGEALPYVSIIAENTTIATSSDERGRFSLTVPEDVQNLNFSNAGYEDQSVPVSSTFLSIGLEPVAELSDEFIEMAPAQSMEQGNFMNSMSGKITGVQIGRSKRDKMALTSVPVQMEQTLNQTSFEFEIKNPYSIPSDSKTYTINMDQYSLPASYEYYCVPKIDKDAFLMAYITGWEELNLMEGEANLFFEDTYIGKSLINLRTMTDTLTLSLGRDKSVVVHRDKIRDFTTKQFIGTKKQESRTWKIIVKNNKNQKISLLLNDQVPVSKNEEIQVETLNISGASINAESGEITWKLELEPAGQKELELKYSVQYPKSKTLTIE